MRHKPGGARRLRRLPLLPSVRMGLGELTAELARAWGGWPALVEEDGTVISFQELHRLTDLVACALIAHHDLRKGERVAIPGDPLRGIVALLGVVKAGGVAVPLPRRLPEGEEEGPARHCHARLEWENPGELIAGVPGGMFIPYTRKKDELAALIYHKEGGKWHGTMVNDRSLLAAAMPLALALQGLKARTARLSLPLDHSAGLAWALACLRAGTALIPSLPADAWLGSRVEMDAGPAGRGRASLVCIAGMTEKRAPAETSLFLDGPCLDETCGFFLLRIRRGGGGPPRLLWPLPHLRYRVDEEGTLFLRGKGLSWGYWGDLEGSLRPRPGGWFPTDMVIKRVGLAFKMG